jgi:hypothetical protein
MRGTPFWTPRPQPDMELVDVLMEALAAYKSREDALQR